MHRLELKANRVFTRVGNVIVPCVLCKNSDDLMFLRRLLVDRGSGITVTQGSGVVPS